MSYGLSFAKSNKCKLIDTEEMDIYFKACYGLNGNKFLDKYNHTMESFWDYGEDCYNHFDGDIHEEGGRLERDKNGLCTCCDINGRCPLYGIETTAQINCEQEHLMDILICHMVGGEVAVKKYREQDVWASDYFYEQMKRFYLK